MTFNREIFTRATRFLVFSITGTVRSLSLMATQRLQGALSTATLQAYDSMFRIFLAFLCFHGIFQSQVTVEIILAYLEFLFCSDKSVSVMRNHVSAIKWRLQNLGIDTSPWDDSRIAMYLKSVQRAGPLSFRLKPIITPAILRSLITACDGTQMGFMYKAVYLLAFFSFLRLSNLVPHSLHSFDYLKHLTQDDVFFRDRSAVILVKWTKTMQNKDQIKLITIPKLNNLLCPVGALQEVLRLVPRRKNAPLFQILDNSAWIPLTDTRVRRHLHSILTVLGMQASGFTFHSFRRSGATFAFQNNVSLQNIKHHGTWSTECVWRYVLESADAGSEVASCFAKLLA